MRQKLDLNGKIFSLLTVICETPSKLNDGKKYWKCLCKCGNEKDATASHLNGGYIKSCGCLKFEDLNGQIFGKLIVMEQSIKPSHIKAGGVFWKCKCECGNETIVPTAKLKNGEVKSCNCGRNLNDKDIAIKGSAKRIFNHTYKDGNLSFDDFYKISQLPCHYCGINGLNKLNRRKGDLYASKFAMENSNFIYNGLDRVDNDLPHNSNNVVPCCKMCNFFKSSRPYDECIKYMLFNNDLNIKNNINIKLTFEELKEKFPQKYENGQNILNTLLCGKKGKTTSRNKHRQKLNKPLIEFNLSKVQMATLILSNCAYCNLSPDIDKKINMGIDRVDNNKGYEPDNVVPCCKYCNATKSNLTLEEFLQWRTRVKNFQLQKIKQSENKNIERI